MTPPTRPVLIYDGECAFCRRWAERIRRASGRRVDRVPYQEAGPWLPQVPREQLAESLHLIEPGGRVSRGAEAVLRALALTPWLGAPLWLYRRVPGFAAASEWGYRWMARRRGRGAEARPSCGARA